jgi:hypothetical protein
MKEWQGIDQSTTPTADGDMLIVNATFDTEGEMARRNGMELAVAQSGVLMSHFYHPAKGNVVVFYTADGSVISEAL